jgi:hypothetical protein
VDDLLAVRIGDRLRRREHVRQQAEPLVERAPLADQLGERAPRHQLHRVERVAGGPAPGLVDRHDRRVLQPGRQQRLAHEPLVLRRALDQQLLDRHRPIQAAVAGPQHAADAALGHLLRDRVRVARDAREVGGGPRVGLRVGGGDRALVADRRGRCPPLMRFDLGPLRHSIPPRRTGVSHLLRALATARRRPSRTTNGPGPRTRRRPSGRPRTPRWRAARGRRARTTRTRRGRWPRSSRTAGCT